MKRKPGQPAALGPEQIREIEAAVFERVERLLDPDRFYLLGVDFEREAGYWYLRVYVEGKGFRISLNDCEAVSRQVEEPIEQMTELKDLSYNLEISSPGVFRPLKTRREIEFYQGQPVMVEELAPTKGKKLATVRNFQGTLEAYDEADGKPLVRVSGMEIPLDEAHRVVLNPPIRLPEDGDSSEGQ